MEVVNENDMFSLYGEGDIQENLLICQWTDKCFFFINIYLHFLQEIVALMLVRIFQSISNFPNLGQKV